MNNMSRTSVLITAYKIVKKIILALSITLSVVSGMKMYYMIKESNKRGGNGYKFPRYKLDMDSMRLVPMNFSEDDLTKKMPSFYDLYITKKNLGLNSDIFIGKYKSLFNLPLFAYNLRLDSGKLSDEDRDSLSSLRAQYLNSFRDWRDYHYAQVLKNPSQYNLMKFRNMQILKNNEMERDIVKKYIFMKEGLDSESGENFSIIGKVGKAISNSKPVRVLTNVKKAVDNAISKGPLKYAMAPVKFVAPIIAWVAIEDQISKLTSGEAKMARSINRKWKDKYNTWYKKNKDKDRSIINAKKKSFNDQAMQEFQRWKSRESMIEEASRNYYNELQNKVPR